MDNSLSHIDNYQVSFYQELTLINLILCECLQTQLKEVKQLLSVCAKYDDHNQSLHLKHFHLSHTRCEKCDSCCEFMPVLIVIQMNTEGRSLCLNSP